MGENLGVILGTHFATTEPFALYLAAGGLYAVLESGPGILGL